MTNEEIQDLKIHNLNQLSQLSVDDGAMIQAIMDAIRDERNGGPAYIRITEVKPYAVYYITIEGNSLNVARVARSLGFKVTPGIIKL